MFERPAGRRSKLVIVCNRTRPNTTERGMHQTPAPDDVQPTEDCFGLITVRAGLLEMCVDGADIRYITYSGVELVRRIYVAVRDLNWERYPERCGPAT